MTTPEQLKGPIGMSVLLHLGLFAFVLITPGLFEFQASETWGGNAGGDSIKATIVGSAPGIALPKPEVVKEDAAANDSKGFYKSETTPKPPPPPEKAVLIPEKNAAKKADKAAKPSTAVDRPSKSPQPSVPDPINAVPFGKGGNPAINYGQSSGPVGADFGDGAFGTKYSQYVQAMNRRISQNWLKGLVDSRVTGTPRVYLSFDIERDGTISNIEVKQQSGIPSLDNSAIRALRASNKLQALPSDYTGSKVSVSLYFEYVK